ncbi:Uncharacterised protein [Yersinia aldovae]|nr:Uncharacterised protein [Yersinia aldovae]
MKKSSVLEIEHVCGGDTGRELAQASGTLVGYVVGGLMGETARAAGGAALRIGWDCRRENL